MSLLDHEHCADSSLGADTLSATSSTAPLSNNVVTPVLDAVRQELAAVAAEGESQEAMSRMFSSDEIDHGAFGMRWHPVSGDWTEGVAKEFEPINHVLVLVTSTSGGWSPSTSSRKTLPRIGDGNAHTLADFPLPHWKFDPWTGTRL
ncbi:hypothetical protein FJZ27_05315 [Candidatus Peribacteria bacterium]|nr:hypothetical protein [Candidatus Peribacteria bacterium]